MSVAGPFSRRSGAPHTGIATQSDFSAVRSNPNLDLSIMVLAAVVVILAAEFDPT